MCICYTHLCVSCSVMSDCVTPSTVACQAPLSMEVSRQEYWSGYPFSILGDLPNSGIKPGSPALQAGYLPSQPPGKTFIYLMSPLIKILKNVFNKSVMNYFPLSIFLFLLIPLKNSLSDVSFKTITPWWSFPFIFFFFHSLFSKSLWTLQ